MAEKVIDSIRCYLRIDGLRIEAGNLLCLVIDAIDSVGSPYPYIFVFVFFLFWLHPSENKDIISLPVFLNILEVFFP